MNHTEQQRCPLTYEPLPEGQRYSQEGLKKISRNLQSLEDIPFSAQEQRLEALKRAHKISIQGVQPKLSARLNIKRGKFEIVNVGGKFILKPQHELYPQLPENEDLTMKLAAEVGIEVPLHGLIYSADGSLTYFIKRFDRVSHNKKLALEDFAQLSENTRITKYNFSMERLVPLIEKFCTFPMIEKRKLFLRTLFNFLIGNEDMHLKNFSLITREGKVEFSPAYDFLNSSIVLGNPLEEIALSLHGKKSNLKKPDLINYFAFGRLGLNENIVAEIVDMFVGKFPRWVELIQNSFLSKEMIQKYLRLLDKRRGALML